MILDETQRKEIESDLRKLPFVHWDRLTNNDGVVSIFGWIDRVKDTYKDFVLLKYSKHGSYWITSSAERTEEIGKLLGTSHNDCVRVEQLFKIPNAIISKGGRKWKMMN